jgi:tRNA 5-methylaminomethyl-2-thiouridine biosynthesis bifunctional protein
VWYLDGFSPAKNSSMWQEPLFQQVARLSIPQQTHLSTFTSAGFVRRALQAQGFSIKKHAGFGKKREMISAVLTDNVIDTRDTMENSKPWFNIDPSDEVKHVAIIGSGLAGCTSAEALARRGVQVTLFDSENEICQHASGNLQGALYAKLPSKPTLGGDLHLTGLEYSLRLLNLYQCFDKHTADQCGLLQLATNEKEHAQQQDLLNQGYYHSDVVRAVNAEQASELAGTKIELNGLYFERAGWVDPKAFCQKIITTHSKISLQLNTEITAIEQQADNRWHLIINGQQDTYEKFDAVIVANANSAKQFDQLSDTSSKGIRGQVTHVEDTQSAQLKTVVCGAGYISPALKNKYCFGASFDLHNQELILKEQDQQTNIRNLNKVLPEFSTHLAFPEQLDGKVAMRCSTPDYLPLVGPAPITDKFISDFEKLKKDKNWRFSQTQAPNYKGLYLNIGHGSKGLITCPLSAEYLACLMTNQPSPISNDLSNAIHPARFVIKQLIRRAI